MVENKDFDTVEYFRKIRDKHASLLCGMRHEDIIAFFGDKNTPNKRLQPTAQSGARSARATLGGG